MSIEEKLTWLLAIIACPFAVLLIPDGGGGRMSERHWHCMSCDRDLGPMVGKHESKCPECGCKSAYCAQEEPDCKRETCHDVCNSVDDEEEDE